MVGLDAVVVYTDEIERQLARLAELARRTIEPACANIDRACRKLVLFLDELVGGAPPVPLKLFPEYEAMQRERGIKVAAATDLFFPACEVARPLPGAPLPVPPRSSRRICSAAPGLPERPPHVPARRWRRCAQDARSGRGAGARRRAGVGKGVLVDRRRVLRRHHRGRTGAGLGRKAACRAARPADPTRRRGLGEGRRAAAARGALLRRRERAGDADRAVGPEGLRPRGAHSDGRGAERGPGPAPAHPARDARAARRGERTSG